MKLGVVIPTLDEADAVEGALRSVADRDRPSASDAGPGFESGVDAGVDTGIEIVVADGGSRDDTCQRARDWGAEMTAEGSSHAPARGPSLRVRGPSLRVLALPRDPGAGRARQLQAGLEACAGDAVLFLHADTRLPAGWAAAVRGALADPTVVGGAFRFAFERDASGRLAPGLRAIEWGARVRERLLGLPYGDQAIFARRPVLEAIGGVPQAPIMEDLDLVHALKRHGRLARLAAPATTSPRRYRANGVLRTFLRNLVALSAWRLGVDRARVAAWYRGRPAAAEGAGPPPPAGGRP